MASQWAVKRLCKFLLKRLLGRVILGEIDLDQLEVQLGSGSVQLNELSLNADYLNDQLADASVVIKEGSIGCIRVAIPWKALALDKCEVEIDELELVLLPRLSSTSGRTGAGKQSNSGNDESIANGEVLNKEFGSDTNEPGMSGASTYLGVHDGVRMVAKMVEKVLLGLRVRVRNIIIAFEGQPGNVKNNELRKGETRAHSILIARIGHIEFGAESPVGYQESSTSIEQMMGSQTILIKFVRFENVFIELLDVSIDDGEKKVTGRSPVPIVSGISGYVRLSMPWMGGGKISMPKLNMDISITPLKVEVTAYKIERLFSLFQMFQGPPVTSKPSGLNRSGNHCSQHGLTADTKNFRTVSPNSNPFPATKFIPDWMISSSATEQKSRGNSSEEDLSASVDEFFDCFDGTWSSQASLMGSGIWTWTCSAFNAITTASSLASGGAVSFPDDLLQQPEYDIKVKAGDISVMLLFGDLTHDRFENERKDKSLLSCREPEPGFFNCLDGGEEENMELHLSCLEVSLQASSCHSQVQMSVQWMEIYEHLLPCSGDRVSDGGVSSSAIDGIQVCLEDVFPSFPVSIRAGVEAEVQRSSEGRKEKSCLFRMVASGSHPAVYLVMKQENSRGAHAFGQMHVKLQLQPAVLRLEVEYLSKLFEVLEAMTIIFERCCKNVVGEEDAEIGEGVSINCPACSEVDSMQAKKMQVDVFIPSLRFLALFKTRSESVFQDSCLCFDLHSSKVERRPLVSIKNYNGGGGNKPNNALFSTVFSFSKCVLSLANCSFVGASNILNIESQDYQEGLIDIAWRQVYGGGGWLVERALGGVEALQNQGDGKSSSVEFAAATSEEVVEDINKHIREDIVAYSSLHILVSLPTVNADLSESDCSTISSFVDCLSQAMRKKGNGTLGDKGANVKQRSPSQISILVNASRIQVALHPTVEKFETNIPPTRKEEGQWESLRLDVQRFELLFAFNLGTISGATYFWLQHGDGNVWGVQREVLGREELLLCCRKDALGRGDGSGGNALAGGSAGIEIFSITPQREELEGVLTAVTLRGATLIARGGRLDWISVLTSFFGQTEGKDGEMSVNPGFDDDSNRNINGVFSLDLHDIAICYEPGQEAALAAALRAMGSVSVDAESFSPVACVLAAASVRVSSRNLPATESEDYRIFLRDVALLVHDTTLRATESLSYTAESLREVGYVKVAGDAVMEAIVRMNGEDGVKWEVECANNRLRFETCHDTTAALGRLLAQLQQLLAPDVGSSVIHEHERENKEESDNKSSIDGITRCELNTHRSPIKLSNGNKDELLESVHKSVLSIVTERFENGLSDVDPSSSSALATFEALSINDGFENGSNGLHSNELAAFEALSTNKGFENGSNGLHSNGLAAFEALSINNDFENGSDGLHSNRLGTCEVLSTSNDFENGSNGLHSNQPTSLLPEIIGDVCMPSGDNTGLSSFIEDFYFTSAAAIHCHVENSNCDQSGSSCQDSEGDPVSFRKPGVAEGKGGWYEGDRLQVLEDHVVSVSKGPEPKRRKGHFMPLFRKPSPAAKYPPSVGRVVLQDLNVQWRLYRGSDWKSSTQDKSDSNQNESGRCVNSCLEVILDGIELQHDTFPEIGEYASRLALSVKDICVYDCRRGAPWKRVLGYHQSKSRPRETSAQALKLELEAMRPDPLAPLEEYRLLLALLPIRLHVHQEHFDFLNAFFSYHPPASSGQGCVGDDTASMGDKDGIESIDEQASPELDNTEEEAILPFFQVCDIHAFTIRVDYVPHRFDLGAIRSGNFAEFVNLVSWKGIELQLKHVHATNVYGLGMLSSIVAKEWVEDISQNQVHKLIKGLGPIRPFVAVGSGAAKLIVLPRKQYKKDKRIFRGVQKGATAFLRSLSLEAVGLGVHLAAEMHELLVHAESALGGVLGIVPSSVDDKEFHSRASQPGSAREGLRQACVSLTDGFEKTASSLIGNPLKVYQRGASASLAMVSALRAAPVAVITPVSSAAEAVYHTLLGVRNSLDPERKRESEEKHSDPQLDLKRKGTMDG